jgi:AcrR family transcriptional regulator
MPAKTAKRTYNSSRRTLQAAQTREEVLRAGTKLFDEKGWAGTTLAAIAEEAGVSVETIYKGFGSKKRLLREAMDVAVVGDAEPIPYSQRPEFASLGEGTLAERTARGIGIVALINERSAGIWQAIVEAASADEEVSRWRVELEENRRVDTQRSVELILGREVEPTLVTLLWVLYSPETYRKLVVDSGMSRAEYEALLVDASERLVFR